MHRRVGRRVVSVSGRPSEGADACLLDGYETVTGYGVTPVVAFIRPGFVLEGRREPGAGRC